MTTAKTAPGGLSKFQLTAYAGAYFSTILLSAPVANFLPQLYAKELGVSLSALGVVIVVTQVLDAFNQQICGFLSDRTRTRWGARKPWIAGGATLAIFAAFFLMRPPPGVGLVWFVCWKILYDFAWTAKNIGYSAWGAELSGDYRTRSKIMGAAGFAGQLGNVANETLPILLFTLGLTASTAYSMKVMGFYWIAGLIMIPLLHGAALAWAPVGVAPTRERPDLLGLLTSVKANKPFWRYLASFTMTGLGIGALSLNFTFYDGYLKVGKWFPYLMTIYAVTMVLTIPLWVWICNRFGKHKAYTISMLISGCAPLGWALFDPDVVSQTVILSYGVVVVFLIGLGVGCNIVTGSSMLADIADYGTLKTGVRRTASYFAFYLLTNKVAIAIGAGIAFATVSAFGYNPKAGASNTHEAKMALLLVYSVAPVMLKAPAAIYMWWYPLTAKRHGIIQRRLQSREDRLARSLAFAADQTGIVVDPTLLAGPPPKVR